MDGIARNTTGFDADLTGALVPLVAVTILLLSALLAIAIGVEILRRAGIAVGIVRHLDRIVPESARRIAAGLLSLSVTLVGAAPASASDAPVRDWLSGSTTTTTTPVATEDSLIQRVAPATSSVPVVVPPTVPPTVSAPTGRAVPADQIVVIEGDCLWTIAARRLAIDAGNPAIDAAWRAIYALNRSAIGDDPNLVLPGLHLALPPNDPPPYAAP